jgi:hypothetical protein
VAIAQETVSCLKPAAFEIFVQYASVLIVLSSYLLQPADLVGLFATEKVGWAEIARNRCNWEFAKNGYC